MKKNIRWKQRFENFEKAIIVFRNVLTAYNEVPDNEINQIALIQAFKFTYELGWKTLKDYLKYGGIEVDLPRDVITMAFQMNLIQDGQTWINMLEDRNVMAHVYDHRKALLALKNISKKYVKAIEQVYYLLQEKV